MHTYRFIRGLVITGVFALAGCVGDGSPDRAPLASQQPLETDTGSSPSGVVGDGITPTDPGVLKDAAAAICAEVGLQLTAFDYVTEPDSWLTTQASYACGELDEEDPSGGGEDPSGGGEDPSVVYSGTVGDGLTPTDPLVLKEAAAAICAGFGLELSGFEYLSETDSGFASKADFTCTFPTP